MEHWLRTDEIEETVSALKATADFLRRTQKDIYHWKWVILGLHSALQGFMVLALSGSHGLNVLREGDAKRWLEAHKKGDPYPTDLKLDDFLNLYKKTKTDLMLMYVGSQKFMPRGSQGGSIKRLNSLRNEFVHFRPKGWSLEVSGLPVICNDTLDVAEFLGWGSGNLTWPSDHVMCRAMAALNEAREAAGELQRSYV